MDVGVLKICKNFLDSFKNDSQVLFYIDEIFNFTAKSGLQLDTLDEQRMKKIRELEHYERPKKDEVEPDHQKPVFITPLHK